MHYGHSMSLPLLEQITGRVIVRGSQNGRFGYWAMYPREVPYYLGKTLDLAANKLGVVCDENGCWHKEVVEGAGSR